MTQSPKDTRTPILDWKNVHSKDLEPHFCNWMLALTSEGLHRKADIATVLAMQSAELSALTAQVERLEKELNAWVVQHEGKQEELTQARLNFRAYREAAEKERDAERERCLKEVRRYIDNLGGENARPCSNERQDGALVCLIRLEKSIRALPDKP